MGTKGTVASTAALALLLQEGIGRHDPRLAHSRSLVKRERRKS